MYELAISKYAHGKEELRLFHYCTNKGKSTHSRLVVAPTVESNGNKLSLSDATIRMDAGNNTQGNNLPDSGFFP